MKTDTDEAKMTRVLALLQECDDIGMFAEDEFETDDYLIELKAELRELLPQIKDKVVKEAV